MKIIVLKINELYNYFIITIDNAQLIFIFVSTNQINDMKPQIELFDVEQVSNHYAVTCEIYDIDGKTLADVSGAKVTKGELLAYVIDNGLNVSEFANSDNTDVYQVPQNATTYLAENLDEVVKAYMLDTFEKGEAA